MGALNLYSEDVDPFDEDAQAVGLTLAAQIAVAFQAVREIETRGRSIITRTVIGQAQGILMERYRLNADQAFAVLRRISQDKDIKLVTLAGDLVHERHLPS